MLDETREFGNLPPLRPALCFQSRLSLFLGNVALRFLDKSLSFLRCVFVRANAFLMFSSSVVYKIYVQ